MTRILSLFIDAWEQLKLQRVRVLMSLFGVTVAVAALTASIAMGNVLSRYNEDMMLRSSGPAATYTISISGADDSLEAVDTVYAVADRYGVTYASPAVYFDSSMGGDMFYANGTAVGPRYFEMHALDIVEGRGFERQDADRLAPVAVVSKALADELGLAHPSQHPVIEMQDGTQMLVVGFVSNRYSWDTSIYIMAETYVQVIQPNQAASDPYFDPGMGDVLDFVVSVPPGDSTAFAQRIVTDLRAELPGANVQAYRSDAGAYSDFGPDPGVVTTIVLGAVSVAILALGALSLINIAVVTVRFRIREFGIRRAFGASQRRIFLSVMLESVVGTFIAGVFGVGLVAVLYRSPLVLGWAQDIGMQALPSFPVTAAVAGIVTSIVTGAVAGLIPALIAVRSKVIDAIRF